MEKPNTDMSEYPKQDLAMEAQMEKDRRKRRRIIRSVLTILFVFLVLIIILAGIAAVVMAVGGSHLRSLTGSSKPSMTQENETGTEQTNKDASTDYWKEGWVRYQDKVYEYNEDIMTFLIMGIDQKGEVTKNPNEVNGGQADALFLAVVNPEDKSVKLIAVNRDTMTDVLMYGYEGADRATAANITAQIATQHGFGDGEELSCELTEEAVSKLFYDLPIHGYMAINMGAISQLNDAIGGVKVTALEDLQYAPENIDWTKGDQLELHGMEAFIYVKYRDTTVFESNRNRLARQKQYLTAFSKKAVAATKKDITLPLTLYGQLNKYMVTDITADELTYLVGTLMDYRFETDTIYTLEGETIMGEKHEEFYPDQEALKELMLQIFYREVDMQSPQ